jgi:hypothetical protein
MNSVVKLAAQVADATVVELPSKIPGLLRIFPPADLHPALLIQSTYLLRNRAEQNLDSVAHLNTLPVVLLPEHWLPEQECN